VNTDVKNYLDELAKELKFIQPTINSCVEYWSPEEPPVTVLFGEIGDSIVQNIESLPEGALKACFNLIESGMTSRGEDIGTAVATGLIESMVTKSDGDPQLWNRLEELFGAVSKIHANAWRKFGQ